MRTEFTAGPDDDDRRLETVLRKLCPSQSLGGLHKALRRGDVRLNGAKAAPEARVHTGDRIAIWDALLPAGPGQAGPKASTPLPEGWVIYEGSDLVVVNKPSGLVVHRGDGPQGASAPLDDRVRDWLVPAQASLGFRPGPLHRLDRETSGLVVFSRTLEGARSFSAALAGRQVTKTYLAVLSGSLDAPAEVVLALSRDQETRMTQVDDQGDGARSVFRPLARSGGLTLAEVDLGTGRTHQIRVHAQSLGHPLAGDTKYGGGPAPRGLDVPWLLHAWKLSCALLPPLVAPLPPGRAGWVENTFHISL